MKSIELQERLAKAQEKVEKLYKTIERHEAQAQKKLDVIIKNGWNPEDRYCKQGTPEHHDCYWAVCEYSYKLEDIKNANTKLAEAQQVVKNWEAKLEKRLALENTIATEMPEVFRELQNELSTRWTEFDIEARNVMKQKARELDYKEFRKLYTYSAEQSLRHTDEEFKKMNEREAEMWIIDLYNRVKAITGEVTDWSNVYFHGKALNGFVKGENGTAEVETILAGGYNIQRLHYRVLVKAR